MEQNIKGLILEPTKSAEDNINLNLLEEVLARDIKIVFINATYKELEDKSPNVGYILMDDVKGGFIATRYLLETGHRKIAGIFKRDDIQGVRREEGYRKALESFGVVPEENMIARFTTEDKIIIPKKFVHNLLSNKKNANKIINKKEDINNDKSIKDSLKSVKNENNELIPDAIVCYNDEIAVKVIQAIKECGLSVPQDISVVGYDDSSLATVLDVGLTTVKHPKKQMGELAAHHLIEMLENNCGNHKIICEPELVIRSSCRIIK